MPVSSANSLVFWSVFLSPCALLAHFICLKAPRLQSSCLCVPLPQDSVQDPTCANRRPHLESMLQAQCHPGQHSGTAGFKHTHLMWLAQQHRTPRTANVCPGGQSVLQTQLDWAFGAIWRGFCTWQVGGTLLHPIFPFSSRHATAGAPQDAGKERTLGGWEDSLEKLIPNLQQIVTWTCP